MCTTHRCCADPCYYIFCYRTSCLKAKKNIRLKRKKKVAMLAFCIIILLSSGILGCVCAEQDTDNESNPKSSYQTCARYHVVTDPVNETMWTLQPYGLRKHQLQLLNPQDNLDLLIPGQMLCVQAVETTSKAANREKPPVRSPEGADDLILNSDEYGADLYHWSRVASIETTARMSTQSQQCTGTFITADTVITSANCVAGLQPNSTTVIQRKSKRLGQMVDKRNIVSKIAVHPLYKPQATGNSHNVAILTLEQKAQFNRTGKEIRLPTDPAAVQAGAEDLVDSFYVVMMNPWSQKYIMENGTEAENKTDTVVQKHNKVNPVQGHKCRELFWAKGFADFYLADDMICTVMDPDEWYYDVCRTGNGAPLIQFDRQLNHYYVIGIGVATAGGCAMEKFGHDYIFVDLRHKSNWDWLQKAMSSS
ncbi:uncharacterized protein LOC129593473 [Paramacrobiotus metropolitanus]|uniref:uncharacterized protein LOC129593473 n=1 Tax=Paramacrobiotus metropolitanus TaxID=2943436 RepID=UPI002446082D|nr:uncharacterized protein LOC129593473 [Paramacrobiotus metropolitanus]